MEGKSIAFDGYRCLSIAHGLESYGNLNAKEIETEDAVFVVLKEIETILG